MPTLPALLFAVGLWAWLVGATPGADDGRRGNRHYAEGAFDEASGRYAAGLDVLSAHPPGPARRMDLAARLHHNHGLALYEQERYDDALAAFLAATAAPDPALAAAGFYGAGLAAARLEQVDAALAHFAAALRLQPDFPAAAYNWEWLRRQMDDTPPEENEESGPIEPSPFAESLKAQADELVAARRYREAQTLMTDGLEQDSTVGAYADFTERLGAVAEIDEL